MSSSAQAPPALSPLERPAFAHLFSLADPQKTGIVTGDAAVKFFGGSKLPPATLGTIWALADSANNGFLTAPSFSVALRLIAHAQRGETPSEALINKPGLPPTFEGVTLPGQGGSAIIPQSTGNSHEIKPEDRARYTRIFATAGPQGGLLDGDKAKEIFVKSKLPYDKLGAIWNLADTKARGALDLTDFIIGMHFIQNTMSGTLTSIPAALPAGLYEQAVGGAGASVPGSPLTAQHTGGSAGGIPRQLTGQPVPSPIAARALSPPPPGSALRSPLSPGTPSGFAPIQAQRTGLGSSMLAAGGAGPGAAWDVTPEDKVKADRFFEGLDTEHKGLLDGQVVVPFFMQSKLPEAVLAHVWDLSDILQNGSLTRDEFAVAMHLINNKLAGRDLPQQLPPSLVPPSLRGQTLPEAVNPQQSDTQKDLFSLMDDDPPPLPISTSSAFVTPNAGPRGVVSPPPSTAALRAPPAASSAPFDDDFFGTSAAVPQAAPAAPATPVPTGARSPPPPTPSQAQPFGDQDADYGNKQLQLNSTQKAVSDLQTKRGGLESAVSQNDSSIAELESRLATVRSTHKTESKLVKDLEERQRMQSEELRKLREEVIRGESDLSALRAEKDEVEQAVMRDREDVRDMKRRMGEVQNETAQLKAQLEKLRKAARQQKGLLAIGKKQLSAAETDKETVARDITDVENGARPIEDVEASHTAAFGTSPAVASAVPLPETPAGVLSPAGSVRSTNPFDRFTSPGSAGRPDSPSFVKPEADTLARSATGEEHASGASAAVLGDAAGAAAALGLGGVAVAAREESNAHETQATNEGEDPFGVPSSAAPAPSHGATGFDDAFAVPEPSSHPVARPAEGSFDDNFADSFVPNSASGQAPQQGISEYASREATAESADFDDAFKNFGEQPLGRVARPSDGAGFDSTSAATSSSAPETAPVTSSDAILAEQAVGQHAPAPRADEVVTNTDVATLPPAVPPKVRDDAEDEASDADSSSDEEEGPEDVEGPRIGSPDEAGLGKSAGKAPVNELAKPGGGLGGLRSENSNAAANRFPELDSALDQEDLARSAQAQSAASEALAVPAAAPVSSLSSDQLMPGALTSEPEQDSAAPAVGSAISENAIKQQLTGATDGPDAFVDAATGETPQTAEFGNATIPVAAPASAAGALGGSHFSQRSDVGHERFATAFDEPFQTAPVPTALSTDVPTAAPVEGKSGSPSSSMKTRRDPPPRPVRNAAGGSTSTLPYPSTLSGADLGTRAGPQADTFEDSPFGNDFAPAQAPTQAPVTSAASTQQAGPQVASFDDFDSAFEDLGPAERQPAGAATSAAPDAGFDDAFDEGFDFVPSFAAPGAGSSAGANPTVGAPASAFKGTAAQNTSSAATQGFGFEDFDSTFEPAIKATGGPAGSVGAGPTASSVHNSQPGSGSGFSFDDAFGPTAPTPQLSAPAGSGLAPSLPPRSNTAGLGPTAAAGAGPEPPRVPARAPTGGPAKNANEPAPTPALPDDAPPVRQLCGMGFSRQQAIAALEKHNYRVERALEYLLARA